jgi:rhodanese-related sulfurtransferase
MNTISVEDIYEIIPDLTDKECIIDVRTNDEYNTSHISPSRHIPIEQLDEHLESLQQYDTLYFFCRSGNRSGKACELLTPYLNAALYNIEGGLLEWESQLLPTVSE